MHKNIKSRKTFICEDIDEKGNPIRGSGCGEITNVIFNGYQFGNQFLEDVKFKAYLEDNEIKVECVEDWENDPYLAQLNKEYWLGCAWNFALKNDVAECPICGNEIDAQPINIITY